MTQDSNSAKSNSSEGRYSEVEYIEAVQENEPAGTSEVAEIIGVARQSADYRLKRLESMGKIRSKKVGSSLVWTVVTSPCERCEDRVSIEEMELVVLGTPMEPVGRHEEAPITDATWHELCPNCHEEWIERLHSPETLSFSSFLEDIES